MKHEIERNKILVLVSNMRLKERNSRSRLENWNRLLVTLWLWYFNPFPEANMFTKMFDTKCSYNCMSFKYISKENTKHWSWSNVAKTMKINWRYHEKPEFLTCDHLQWWHWCCSGKLKMKNIEGLFSCMLFLSFVHFDSFLQRLVTKWLIFWRKNIDISTLIHLQLSMLMWYF